MSALPPSALHDSHSILEEYMPEILWMLATPHIDTTEQWLVMRSRLDGLFDANGFLADESRVAFDLLVAFAEYTIEEARVNS